MGSLRQRRIAIGIIFSTLGLTSLFTAQGTTRLFAKEQFALAAPSGAGGGPQGGGKLGAGAGTGSRRVDPKPILHRNIFDSQTGPLDGSAMKVELPEQEKEQPEPIDPDQPPPTCEGSMKLVGAVVSEYRPDWSFAAIVGTTGKAMLYRPGMSIDGRELVGIRASKVYLQPSGGELCQLAMFSPEKPSSSKQGKKRRRVRVRRPGRQQQNENKSKGGISSSELEQGIERVSETEYNIDRSLVDKLLQNQAELMRTARIIPHEKNGRVQGVKMYGIRRNSLLGKLGLNNGDMLRTINGYDMTSPDKALEAYSKLRNKDHLTVAVQRRGKDMTIDYNIR